MFKLSHKILLREAVLPDKTYWHIRHALEHSIFILTLVTDPAHFDAPSDVNDQLDALRNALSEAYFDMQSNKKRRIKQPLQFAHEPNPTSPNPSKGDPK